MQNLTGGGGEIGHYGMDEERLRLQIEHVQALDCDIICLQEAFAADVLQAYREAFPGYTMFAGNNLRRGTALRPLQVMKARLRGLCSWEAADLFVCNVFFSCFGVWCAADDSSVRKTDEATVCGGKYTRPSDADPR